MKLVAAGGDIVATITSPLSVTAGLGYQFLPCSFQTVTRTYQTRIEWLDSSGTPVRTRWQSWAGRTAEWLASSMGDLAPDGAVAAPSELHRPGRTCRRSLVSGPSRAGAWAG
jgi:hypothetical protein